MFFKSILMKRKLLTLSTSILLSATALSQTAMWINDLNGPISVGQDMPSAIKTDASGNTYVTGYISDVGGSGAINFGTVKYNSSGGQEWFAVFNSAGTQTDIARDLAVDGSGNVYVLGSTLGPDSTDYTIVKYNSSGTQQWSVQLNGPGDGYDEPHSVAVDPAGNVYATGLTTSTGGDYDYMTVKYNSSGSHQWTVYYDNTGATDVATRIAVDGWNIYVAGTSQGATIDYVVVKYDDSGGETWTRAFDGAGSGNDELGDMDVSSGNVYLTGRVIGAGAEGSNYGTVVYNNAGTELWHQEYHGTGTNYDMAYGITADAAGNVYVTGVTLSAVSGFYDFGTIKYNSGGTQLWAKEWNGSGNADDEGKDIAVDGSGNVFVTGYTDKHDGVSPFKSFGTVMYDTNGNLMWNAEHDGSGNADDKPVGIALIGSDPVVTGVTVSSTESSQYTTIRYCTAPAAAGAISGPTTMCESETPTFSVLAIPSATSYVWSVPAGATITAGSGSNTIMLSFASGSTGGTITVHAVNSCNSGASSSITINVDPLPTNPTITQSGSTLQSSTGTSYQWYFNTNPISGATSQTYSPPADGSYQVSVWNSFGCSSTSAPFNYVASGIETAAASSISLSPNPSTGIFVLQDLDKSNKLEQIRVYDMLGSEVRADITYKDGQAEINLGAYPAGMYLLRFMLGERPLSNFLMKQ
jgi:hypothetical protein